MSTHIKTISTDSVTEDRIKQIISAIKKQKMKVSGADVRRVAMKLMYDMIIDMELKGMKYGYLFEKSSKEDLVKHESLR